MKTTTAPMALLTLALLSASAASFAGQIPGKASDKDIPISHQDRVYAAEQYSNTVSVVDPVDNKLLGVINLGDPQPGNLSPLYRGEVLVHGMGFSPDHKTLAVVSIGTNSVSFIDTETNTVKHKTYVGRAPHEAFFTPNGKEVWVTVRGEDYVSVIDAKTYKEKTRIKTQSGPGMQIFSPDGKYGYVCSSFNPVTEVFTVADHKKVGEVAQASPFCPNIAASADGKQVWFTLKDIGKAQVFEATPPFKVLKTLDIGPIANHVNLVNNAHGSFAYITVGGLNEVQVYRTDNFEKVATIKVGRLPHGIWPSGDGTRIYVGLENDDAFAVIDTLTNKLVGDNIPIGQAPQAIAYVPNAVTKGPGTDNLKPLGLAGQAEHLSLQVVGKTAEQPATSVTLFSQGLTQVLQAGVSGLEPKQPYTLALSQKPDGSGKLEPLLTFMTNPAGAAVVSTVGPIRQIVQGDTPEQRRYLVIVDGKPDQLGAIRQVQSQ
ncbi:YncE family protein [Pseudomonas gingeri]|uniref:YncE family protein n=1 Tax=Pseudomonas gingeri TaxID=117681 RepID=UPI0015A4018B|nr:YncE family protein [Pseudomonas gingeri]NWD04174.1 beta-propeller fold lactonase family protein [Pseudomonas gingeri]NWE34194.1 beta-propeller fold lactonase family protein [Pseudomonas gingeri]NWE56554.1 beta-propeller fold lactonase family protein [Pseudomonas gingeri]NWF01070.1 beta-propeller fold lactonase family protein [Pseudomonas gingeri]